MLKYTKRLTGLAVGATLLTLTGLGATSASAYAPEATPVVPAVSQSSCNKSPCILYPKSVQLPNGRMLMAYEDSTGAVVGQDVPIYKSDDNGDTWQKLTDLGSPASRSSSSTYAGLTSNWTNPYFFVLTEDLGSYKKGTVLLSTVASSGKANSNDRLNSAIVLWASTDSGATWQLASKVAASPTQYQGVTGETVWQDPVWEPFIMQRNGKLVVFYSDERDALSVDATTGVVQFDPADASSPDSNGQILVHTTWDGVNAWTAPVVDVTGLTEVKDGKARLGGGRPGMTNIVPTTDGKWLLTYEWWAGGDNVRYKIADDPLNFRSVGGAEGTGISALPVPAGQNRLAQGGSPVITTRPDGSIVYNAANSGSVWVNESGRSDGVWKEYQTPVAAGYSRNLQYVPATGRIQILQAPWGTGPVTAGQVDLGKSAGTYYTLVNRATGEILSTEADKAQDSNLTGNTADIITWADNPSNATQRWHAVQKGSAVTFLNKAGGRALGIWQGNASAGARITQWVDDDSSDKKWNLVATSDGFVRIQSSKNTSLYMTAASARGAVALQTQLPASNDDLQEWKLVPSN